MCWGRHLRPEAPRDQGCSGNLEGGPEPCPGGKSSLLPGRALGGWSPTSCCRPVRLLGQVHFFSSYFLFSRHYESSAKECERSEVFFHSAGVMRDPRKSTEGNLGTVRVATSGLRLMEITKGQKPTVSATRKHPAIEQDSTGGSLFFPSCFQLTPLPRVFWATRNSLQTKILSPSPCIIA